MTATITPAITPLAASPSVRLPFAKTRRRGWWAVGFSLLLHLLLLVMAIVAAQHKRSLPQAAPPASVAMVFEGGGKAAPSIANPAPVSPNRQASPEPQPAAPPPPPPAPPAEQTPPLPPPPIEQSLPPTAPPNEVPPPQEVVPPAQEVAPPPVPTPQPLPETAAPATTPPPTPAPEAVPLPPPVPVPEATPRPATQRPVLQRPALPRLPRTREAAARPISPPRAGPAFPAPTDFSLGPRFAAPEADPPRPRASHGTIDLSFAPMMGGGDITQLHPQGKGDDVGEDWFNEVAGWWLRHRFYPSEAGRLQQEGDVELRLVVGRDGRVEAVDVEQRSGSPWLDLGALAVFRDAKLPPLPPDVTDPNVTVDFTIHYVILR